MVDKERHIGNDITSEESEQRHTSAQDPNVRGERRIPAVTCGHDNIFFFPTLDCSINLSAAVGNSKGVTSNVVVHLYKHRIRDVP